VREVTEAARLVLSDSSG